MSEAIVLPTLTQWTKNHLTAIIQAKSASALNATLDAFLFKDAAITVNGRHITRAEFTTLLRAEKLEETTASISFAGAVEVPSNRESHSELVRRFLLITATVQMIIHSTTRLALSESSSPPLLRKALSYKVHLLRPSYLHPSMLCMSRSSSSLVTLAGSDDTYTLIKNRIEQDESLPPPPHNIKGYTDRRRVKVLNEVVLEGSAISKSV